MKKYLRNIIFLTASILFYLIWMNGGEQVYGGFVAKGIESFTTKISSIEKVEHKYFEAEKKTMIFTTYSDRTSNISVEYCLPIVLLLAWQLALFFDKRINYKYAFKLFAINFFTVYFLQIIFPLLLYNISQSKVKATGLFIGLQTFGFLILFLIIKDTILIRLKFSHFLSNQEDKKTL